jgi:hypothetical protein
MADDSPGVAAPPISGCTRVNSSPAHLVPDQHDHAVGRDIVRPRGACNVSGPVRMRAKKRKGSKTYVFRRATQL